MKRQDEEGTLSKILEASKQEAYANPESPDAHYKLGEAYLAIAFKGEEAVRAFKQAIRLKPDFVEAYNGLGWAYLDLRGPRSVFLSLFSYREDIEGAKKGIKAFQKAIRLKPDYAEAYLGLGMAYKRYARYQESVKALENAVFLHPDCAAVWHQISLAYEFLESYEKAAEALSRAIEINLNNSAGIDMSCGHSFISERVDNLFLSQIELGRLYEKMSRYDKAIEAYKQAVEIDPNDAMGYHHLGLAYFASGDKQLAEVQYNILLGLCQTVIMNEECQHYADDFAQRILN